MYTSTMAPETMIASQFGQPSRALMTIDSAYRLTPSGEHARRSERQPVEQVSALAEASSQVLGHAVHAAAVVERHHDQGQEQHGRHGTDPVEVHGRDAVLRAVGRIAQYLDGTEVGRDERQPGDPARQRAATEEEVLARGHCSPSRQPDADDDDEIADQQRVVERIYLQPQAIGEIRRLGHTVCRGHTNCLPLPNAPIKRYAQTLCERAIVVSNCERRTRPARAGERAFAQRQRAALPST